MSDPRPVSRADRIRDVLAVAILGGAGAVYAYAYLGMRDLAAHPVNDPKQQMVNFIRFDHLWNLSRVAKWLFVVGLVGLALSAWMHTRRKNA